MPREIAIATLALLLLWLAANVVAMIRNRRLLSRKINISTPKSLLVIVAHQDDEIICAGGLMIRTVAAGGEVHVVFMADGAPRELFSDEKSLLERIGSRKKESLRALAEIGIPEANVTFLQYENEIGLHKPENIVEAVRDITALIAAHRPERIVTSAFEGGHNDHDMTNFIVARAAAKARFPMDRVYEAPEYNRFYMRDYIGRKLNHFLAVRLKLPPRFLPGVDNGGALDMTPEELSKKKALFRHFESQLPERLVERFGFPDQLQPLPAYDYTKGPFVPAESKRHRFGFLLKRDQRDPFFRGMTLDDYHRVFSEADKALNS